MMALRTVLVVLSCASAMALSACWKTEPDNVLRYKMTVEVETLEGIKSGFAVREMILSTDNIMRPTTGRIRGEAVAVDLPGGKTLFALLTGGDGDVDYAMQIGGRAQVWGKSPSELRATPIELYPIAPDTIALNHTNPLPMLVMFRDVGVPKSVERVDPTNVAAKFGAGVKLKRITVNRTDDTVTTGVEKRLHWLKFYYNRQLDGHRYNDSQNFSNSLNVLSFQQGAE